MNKIKEENFDSLLEKALEENFKEELTSVKVEKFPLSKSFQNKMTSLIKKEEKRKINLLKKVAIYLLIFAGATSLLVNNNQGAKAAFQSLWDWANEYRKITWLDDHIAIDVKRKDEDNIRVEFKEEFIPDGYKINEFKKFGSSYDITVLDKSGKEINIVVIKNSAAISFGLDNEHTTYTNREINNKNYLMGYGVDKEFGNFVLVEHNGYYFDIHSYDATEDQLIELAEKIFEKMEKTLNEYNVRVEFKEEFIPDGYKVEKTFDSEYMKSYDIYNINNKKVTLNLKSTKGIGAIGIDNEHNAFRYEKKGELEFLIVEDIDQGDKNMVISEYKGYRYTFLSFEMPADDLADLAEKIFKNMENSL